ncbi:MAG: hypothetical protein ACREQ9_15490 [Candidatus Binatia bacterium]
MKPKAARLAALVLALLGSPAVAAAQCVELWNGDEPFTHFHDDDGDGFCNADEEPLRTNGTYPNGYYPHCDHADGSVQISHGHFEYTGLQTDAGGASEEKDYLDNEAPDTVDQTMRFATNEPARFERAGPNPENPDRGFWQVDQWIGPAVEGERLPVATWNERFFECSGPLPCIDANGAPSSGGYWSNHRELFDPQTPSCGDAFTAEGAREDCGIVFVVCEPFRQ